MNKKTILFASLLLGGLPLMGTLSADAAVRDTISINQGWQFHRGDVKNIAELKSTQSGDEVVNLPHDFLIGQDWVAPDASERPDNSDAGSNVRSRLSSRGFKEMGIGWYRYEFTPKDEWKGKRIVLDFQGIMLVGDVYLNGKRIGGTDYGYLGFDIDLSKLLKWGQPNEIAVKADTQNSSNSRWFTGAGLYRDVNLIVTNKNLFFPRHPLFIRTQGNKEVKIKAEIINQQKVAKGQSAAKMPVGVRILDADGKVVAEQKNDIHFNAKWRDREYELPSISLENAKLWSPDSPYLYTAEVTLYDNEGNIADQIKEPFGVRTIEIIPQKGLLVNGKKVLLKGYANHHTLGALGAAAYPRAIEKRLKLMKEFGMNHIPTRRTSRRLPQPSRSCRRNTLQNTRNAMVSYPVIRQNGILSKTVMTTLNTTDLKECTTSVLPVTNRKVARLSSTSTNSRSHRKRISTPDAGESLQSMLTHSIRSQTKESRSA